MSKNLLRAPIELAHRVNVDKETKTASYRNDFMRDRDRIMYCNAFRRLDGKTQIYLIGSDDHRRNRLTHTLEVAQIARTISQALGLDEDLTEAIALGHDLGHTPFGHAGERMLNRIMIPESTVKVPESPLYVGNTDYKICEKRLEKPYYGFKHNLQSVRVAALLENGYGDSGLNLTNYTLWGMMHHSNLAYRDDDGAPNYWSVFTPALLVENGQQAWSFEAFVVAQADEIAQWHHDLEDALRSGAMSASAVCGKIREILIGIMSESDKRCLEEMEQDAEQEHYDRKHFVTLASKVVVNTLVTRIVECSNQNLQKISSVHTLNENTRLNFFREHRGDEPYIKNAIAFDAYKDADGARAETMETLERFGDAIRTEIHHSPEVERMNAKGMYIIRKLFQAYATHPQQLPDISIVQFMVETHEKNSTSGANYPDMASAYKLSSGRVRSDFDAFWNDKNKNAESRKFSARVCMMRKISDHIASMTDHYAIEEYEKLYG